MSKIFKRAAVAVLVVTFSAAAVVGFWRPGLLLASPNDGHQLGGDLLHDLCGNTVEAFRYSIQHLEREMSYKYSECDVRETSDGQLVVFHDWDLSDIPDTSENREVLGGSVMNVAVCDVTLENLQRLRLKCGCRIPTLQQVLESTEQARPKKPLLIEIKYLQTDQARTLLLETMIRFRDRLSCELHLLAFIRNLKRSFPNPKSALKEFANAGFRVYQTFRPKTNEYDLCETWD